MDPIKESHREALLTAEQKIFLDNLFQIQSLNVGKKLTLDGLVSNILDRNRQSEFTENIIILRKYLSTLGFSEKVIKELNYTFNLE